MIAKTNTKKMRRKKEVLSFIVVSSAEYGLLAVSDENVGCAVEGGYRLVAEVLDMSPYINYAVTFDCINLAGGRFVDIVYCGYVLGEGESHCRITYDCVVVLVDCVVCAHAGLSGYKVILGKSHCFAYTQRVAV